MHFSDYDKFGGNQLSIKINKDCIKVKREGIRKANTRRIVVRTKPVYVHSFKLSLGVFHYPEVVKPQPICFSVYK